jgi:hypothetical protein
MNGIPVSEGPINPKVIGRAAAIQYSDPPVRESTWEVEDFERRRKSNPFNTGWYEVDTEADEPENTRKAC